MSKKCLKITMSIVLSFLLLFGTNTMSMAYYDSDADIEFRAPGEYGSYYTYKNMGNIGTKRSVLVKYLTPFWDKVSSYTYGSNQNFSVGVSFSYVDQGKSISVTGGYSYSFGATATKKADSTKLSRLGFVCDFKIEKILETKYEGSKPVSSKYIYKSIPIKGTETTKIFYK